MADKRIHELSVTSDKSGKFLALDEAGLPEALKFSADSLIDKAFTDTLYVKLAGDETVNGVKTWVNNGIFQAGITVTLGGIDVTGLSTFDGLTVATNDLTVTTLAAAVADELVFADSAGLFKTSGNLTYNGSELIVLGAFSSTTGGFTQRMDGSQFTFSRNSANYVRCSTAGGFFVFITNGLATSTANANLVLASSQESYFNSNLGIGIVDPAARLHIVGTGNTNSILDSSAANTYLQFQNAGASKGYIGFTVTGDDGIAILNSVGTTHFIMTEAGNCGIGDTTPTAKLEVGGGDIQIQNAYALRGRNNGGTTIRLVAFVAGTNDVYLGAIDNALGKVVIREDGSDVITLLGQNVGIKASNPETRLDLGGVTAGPAVRFFQTAAATGDSNFRLFMGTGLLVTNGNYLFEMGLRYDSTDDNNCGIRWVRGGGTTGGWLSFYANDGTDLVRVGQTDGVLEARVDGANGSSGFGGVVRVSNLDQTILAGEESGSIASHKTNVSLNGAGVVSRIRSHSFDAGGTFWLGFHTGDASSVSTERFTMTHLGSFHVNNAPSNEGLIVDASVVKNHGVRFDVGGLARWLIYCNGTAETGSELGSNLTIAAYSDLGVFQFGAVNIDRKSGRVGVGGINASYALDVQTISTTDSYVARFFNDGGSFGDNGIILKQGLATPIGSTERAITVQDGNGTEVGSLAYDTTSGLRVISILSRKKYKKNFRKAKGLIDATAMLKAAQPKVYNWKGRTPEEEVIITELGEDQKDIFGFVIDDIEPVSEGIVDRAPDPENPGEDIVGYSETGFIKYLVKAVEELSDRLDALE